MIRFAPVAGLVLLAACGLSEAKFTEASTKAACEWLVECYESHDSVDACITDLTPDAADADCTYDAKKAKECLDALNALTCDSALTDYPTVCEDVYDCPDDTAE